MVCFWWLAWVSCVCVTSAKEWHTVIVSMTQSMVGFGSSYRLFEKNRKMKHFKDISTKKTKKHNDKKQKAFLQVSNIWLWWVLFWEGSNATARGHV